MKECVQCFWLSDHREFLEEAAVTGSPAEPKSCRMFVLELPLSNFILWPSVCSKPGCVGTCCLSLGVSSSTQNRKPWFCAKWWAGTSQAPVGFWAAPWGGAELFEPREPSASWRRDPCGSPPRHVESGGSGWGQPKAPSEAEGRALFCWMGQGMLWASQRAWPALLTPEDRSCALTEAVPECFNWVGSAQTPLNVKLSSVFSLLCLFSKANDHQALKTQFWALEMLRHLVSYLQKSMPSP